MYKGISIGVALLIVVGLIVAGFIWSRGESEVQAPSASGDITTTFIEEMRGGVIVELGQPIEGFEPFMFLEVYPGLAPEDFDGVDALIGGYRVEDGEVVYDLMGERVLHSAARAISDEGMETLLINVASRLDINLDSEGVLDTLFEQLEVKSGEEVARVTATLGQTISALDVNITLLEILEDSRCPIDVQCVQAGTVRVEARIESGLGESVMELELNQPITTGAEAVTLVEVRPEPNTQNGEIGEDDYEFVVEIRKR